MAEALQFKILRGLKETLYDNAPKILGAWYITTDTNELFVGAGDEENVTIEPVNQHVIFCKTRAYLPVTLREGIVYVIEEENTICRYDSAQGELVSLSSGSDYNEIQFINGGSSSDNWQIK